MLWRENKDKLQRVDFDLWFKAQSFKVWNLIFDLKLKPSNLISLIQSSKLQRVNFNLWFKNSGKKTECDLKKQGMNQIQEYRERRHEATKTHSNSSADPSDDDDENKEEREMWCIQNMERRNSKFEIKHTKVERWSQPFIFKLWWI